MIVVSIYLFLGLSFGRKYFFRRDPWYLGWRLLTGLSVDLLKLQLGNLVSWGFE